MLTNKIDFRTKSCYVYSSWTHMQPTFIPDPVAKPTYSPYMAHVGPIWASLYGPHMGWRMWPPHGLAHVGPIWAGLCGPHMSWPMWGPYGLAHVGPIWAGPCGAHMGQPISGPYGAHMGLHTGYFVYRILQYMSQASWCFLSL